MRGMLRPSHVAAAALLSLCALGAPSPARAQVLGGVSLRVEGGADMMLTPVYRARFGIGEHAIARAGVTVAGPVALEVAVGNWWFPTQDGNGPVGRLLTVEGGARLFLRAGRGFVGGFVLDVNAGFALTGDLQRFVVDAGIGWEFFPTEVLALGPMVRYVQIVQPDSESVPDDGRLLVVGLSLGLHSRAAPPRAEPPPAPLDTDGDGIPDSTDRCPRVAEDRDGFQDEDGCPDPDNDGDGIPDAPNPIDRCPDRPETRNGFEDEDGCPDEAPPPAPSAPAAPPAPERLAEVVLFAYGSDHVGRANAAPIRAVCDRLSAHAQERIRVLGHADERGTAAYNQTLSSRRAVAVTRMLIGCGVSPGRLESTAYGATRRRCTGQSEDCHRQNRRVEFEIVPGGEP